MGRAGEDSASVIEGLLNQRLTDIEIETQSDVLAFFGRPIAAGLGAVTILIWLSPLLRRRRPALLPARAP